MLTNSFTFLFVIWTMNERNRSRANPSRCLTFELIKRTGVSNIDCVKLCVFNETDQSSCATSPTLRLYFYESRFTSSFTLFH